MSADLAWKAGRYPTASGLIGSLAIALSISMSPVCSAARAAAPSFPAHPVTVIVASSPGSSMELETRILAEKFKQLTGQPLEVNLMPGANGSIGATHVMQSAPNGYTLFLSPASPMVFDQLTHKDLPYDPSKFSPIIEVAAQPLVLVTRGNFPANSLKGLIAYAKSYPKKTYFGSTGIGGGNHLSVLLLAKYAHLDMKHIPYEGAGPVTQALLRGEVDFAVLSLSTVLPWYKEGKLKILAVGSQHRDPAIPQVPTFRQLGYPQQFILTAWTVLVGPPKMPKATVDEINSVINKEYADPDIRNQFKKIGVNIIGGSPAAVSSMLSEERAKWKRVARENGIKPQ